jgi:hypothetical protein
VAPALLLAEQTHDPCHHSKLREYYFQLASTERLKMGNILT